MAGNTGPEKYAPASWRPVQKPLNSVDQTTPQDSERETLDFIRRDNSVVRQHPTEAKGSTTEPAFENLNLVVRQLAATSMEEIDRVIRELENVRAMLRNEGERVTREISSYTGLNNAATTAMQVVADSIKQWKKSQTD